MTKQPLLDHKSITSAIHADKPCGDSAIYEDEFEIIDNEVKKLSALEQQQVDWELVQKRCITLLTTQSKDLNLLCYLTVSLFENSGYQGLAEGLHVLEDVSTSFWDSLYPEKKRMRGRAAAISWLNQRLIISTAKIPPNQTDKEHLESCFDFIDRLNTFFTQNITENTPSLLETSRQLNEYRSTLQTKESTTKKASKPEKDSHTKNQPDEPKKQKNDLTAPASIKNEAKPSKHEKDINGGLSSSDISRHYREIQQSLRPVITNIRSERLSNAQHFYLNRVSSWVAVTGMPVHEKQITQLPPPAKETVSALKSKIESGDFEAAIIEIEMLVPVSPFWLDGHRLSVNAMRELGKPYGKAIDLVTGMVFSLCKRFPELLKLKFSDGTLFASEQFLSWYRSETSAHNNKISTATSNQPGNILDSKLNKEIAALTNKEKLDEVLALIQHQIASTGNIKQQTLLRIAQANACTECNRHDLAYPLYQALDRQQKHYNLEQWEPELAATILQGLLSSYRVAVMDTESSYDEMEQLIIQRLCLLNLQSIV